ncbi:NAD synthase, ammonia-dependent [Natrialba magadii ATCC 43099]|uniref:NH(3)-dependent NAD(+) synthetase n=1 Tax=Natrialba magadii (strain ATCC 43099 / DSM 3394 / CCM 3739 / CIP 104546 / IAM 13178 / JCM 8861 / NBRC 102185 / NCIMB 2190 / MS3) TaxID=547559 RepID=D3STV3_NATMM|nr:NAD(+) synthase [Natrialba magadii]ADD05120.1 NAD synthase, ammonia-dependent [Natrialba magadii ATCC 43099]ELY23158.1 NAD+ synthetase [Natrialba magadii ATCC 43099]
MCAEHSADRTNVHTETAVPPDPFIATQPRLEAVRSQIVDSIQQRVADAGAHGVVVAMSGGLDSTVTATLAVEALGPERVLGLTLPCHKTEQRDARDARTLAAGLGMEFAEIQLRPLLELFDDTVASVLECRLDGSRDGSRDRDGIEDDDSGRDGESTSGTDSASGRPNERNCELGNVVARLRMSCAYYAANREQRLVLGTANRSELALGYFTKYGDGAADTYPIGDLYKTEVRALAQRIGVPRRIISKSPTAGFSADQTDADELGAPYETIDPLLFRLVEQDQSVADAAADLDLDWETARTIAWRCARTEHKRGRPPVPGISRFRRVDADTD